MVDEPAPLRIAHEARLCRARCWLKDCDIPFIHFFKPYAVLMVSLQDPTGLQHTIYWRPELLDWYEAKDGVVVSYSGTQPEFAVFVRRFREGRLPLNQN